MTRIDFYLLQDVDVEAGYRFACRLTGKAVSRGSNVVLHTDSESIASEVDSLLWRFPEQRFLPHGMMHSAAAVGAPVLLSWEDPAAYDGVLVNLSSSAPHFFGRFDRVAEIIVGATRAAGRDRYGFYRDRGFPLYHHEIDDWEAA